MKEQEFKKLVEKTLHVLEGYAIDKNGNKKMHIVGIEKLYKQLTLSGVSQRSELLACCPICSKEMTSQLVKHHHCKKCKEHYTS
jgi:tRNA(Ile2) C34 agmatinyltransferase TiaS